MARWWAGLVLSMTVFGCTGIAKSLANQPVPGYGVSTDLASVFGCDAEEIKTRGDQYRKDSYDNGGPGYVIPSVGDSACDVFAKLGRPDDSRTVETRQGGTVNLWYNTGSNATRDFKAHLVTLEPAESGEGWVVASVAW